MDAEDYSKAEKYEMEQRVIGVGLSPHPLVEIVAASSKPTRPIASLSEGEQATILVEVQSIRTIRTKNGENMAFLQVSDLQKKMDVTLFPDTYRHYSSKIKEKAITISKEKCNLEMIVFRWF